jgi:hypothetical protein
MFDSVVAISVGFGMAAACGFRVFVPMVVIGAAAKFDWLTLSDGFHWLGTWPAIIAFSVATGLEIGAYYFPWLDNLLDSASVPAAVLAGIMVSAACVVDMNPMLKWTLAVIAGGGAAGTVKSGMAGIRLGSTATTGGLGNSVVSTIEWLASLILAALSVFVPILAGIVAVVVVVALIRVAFRLARGGGTPRPEG